MNRWTRRRRRRGSSAGTGPPSTAASFRLWRECLRGHTTPTPSSERIWPAGSTSPRPESRYERGHHCRLYCVMFPSHLESHLNDSINLIQRLLYWHILLPYKIKVWLLEAWRFFLQRQWFIRKIQPLIKGEAIKRPRSQSIHSHEVRQGLWALYCKPLLRQGQKNKHCYKHTETCCITWCIKNGSFPSWQPCGTWWGILWVLVTKNRIYEMIPELFCLYYQQRAAEPAGCLIC